MVNRHLFKPLRSTVAGVIVAVLCGSLLWVEVADSPQASPTVRLTAEGKTHWYRGNLHTHSLWSDGNDYLEMIALWYKDHGYDFLCFTDHNLVPESWKRWISAEKNRGGKRALDKLKARFPGGWVEERTVGGKKEVRLKTLTEMRSRIEDPGRFLLLQGEEISDHFGRLPIHMNASNVQEAVPPLHGTSVTETIQNNLDAVIAQRERTGKPILVHLNHPNFGWGITAEDLLPVRGENFFEVYNGHPTVHNSGDAVHASTERIWDILLAHRLADLGMPVMFALATDDGHSYHNIPSRASEPGRGWIMVLSPELGAEALINAIEAGRFYATCGVRLQEIASGPEGLDVAVDPEPGVSYTIDFIGTRKGFRRESTPVTDAAGKPIRATRRYSDDIGRIFKTVHGERGSYRFANDDLYVRARVISTKKHPNPSEIGDLEKAWVQPVGGPAALKP